MKTTDTNKPTQFPEYWDEDWLKIAIDELDSRKMTPDEKASLEILIARNAEAVKAESRKIAEAENKKSLHFVTGLLHQTDFDINKIANLAGVSVEFVLNIQQKLSVN